MRTRSLASLAPLAAALALNACCTTPTYTPTFWNDGGQVQWNNNCYNYSNNKRTDSFAQPGLAHGAMYATLACADVIAAAQADGLHLLAPGQECRRWWIFGKAKIALVVAPGWDYHWYRRDRNGMWTHKPGSTQATNLDNSNQPITDPETCDRGWYTDFCAYFCTCSSATEGSGHADIQ
jgi:hypothetical protein